MPMNSTRAVRSLVLATLGFSLMSLFARLVGPRMTIADQGEDREAGAPVELDRKPGEGEQCIVCGVAIEVS